MYECICIYIYMFMCIGVCMNVYVYIYIYVCVCLFVVMHAMPCHVYIACMHIIYIYAKQAESNFTRIPEIGHENRAPSSSKWGYFFSSG